jgi:hypothetical protein
MRMAFSLASAPALVKNTLLKPSGASSTMRFAASPRARLAVAGAMVTSSSSCAFIAASTGMLIANVDVDQLAAEIEVGIAFIIPQLAAFCPGDHQRIELPCIDHE